MDIKTTGIRGNHHWKRYATRALVAYNALMASAMTLMLTIGMDPMQWHWK